MRIHREYRFAAKVLEANKKGVYITFDSPWMRVEGATPHVQVASVFGWANRHAIPAIVHSTTCSFNLHVGAVTAARQRSAAVKIGYLPSAGRRWAPGKNQFNGNMLDEMACEMKILNET